MNERIKDLYKEATGDTFANDFDARVLAAEKFAELILEECAKRSEAYSYMSENFNMLAWEIRSMKE